MIIVKLMGGLGNQMFQYSLGRSLSIKKKCKLVIDDSFLKIRTQGFLGVFRDYELNLFPKLRENIKIEDRGKEIKAITITEKYFHYDDEIEKRKELGYFPVRLTGYWQSPKYFEDCESVVRDDFQFPIESTPNVNSLMDEISSKNSVMINVRRTDYLNGDYFEVLGRNYFSEAIRIMEKKHDDLFYYVFSDDIEWCKQNFQGEKFFVVDHSYAGHKFIDYLNLMKNCKHQIISNSTFAWWSAWLNPNKEKTVIRPNKWFVNKDIIVDDLFPQNWIGC